LGNGVLTLIKFTTFLETNWKLRAQLNHLSMAWRWSGKIRCNWTTEHRLNTYARDAIKQNLSYCMAVQQCFSTFLSAYRSVRNSACCYPRTTWIQIERKSFTFQLRPW